MRTLLTVLSCFVGLGLLLAVVASPGTVKFAYRFQIRQVETMEGKAQIYLEELASCVAINHILWPGLLGVDLL